MKIRDKGIDVTNKSGLWLPEGFFDGPDNDDIFLSQLILVFGHPVNNIWRLIFIYIIRRDFQHGDGHISNFIRKKL